MLVSLVMTPLVILPTLSKLPLYMCGTISRLGYWKLQLTLERTKLILKV
jgi:hypothetical protein